MVGSILIVRPGALGDTILTLPLIQSIRRRHSEAEITLLGNSAYKDLLPSGVNFEPLDGRRWLGLFTSLPKIESRALPIFDRAYVILHRPEAVIDNLQRAGTRHIDHVSSRPSPGIHMVEHLHRGLGLPVPRRRASLMHMSPEHEDAVIWVHPGSGGRGKCLPIEAMAAIARALQQRLKGRLAITSGEADGFLMSDPHWKWLVEGPDTEWIHDRPLKEVCSRLGSARLFVGNDSGIGHLAAGLGIPSAVTFVRTDPVQWEPWARREHVKAIDLRGSDDADEAIQARLSDLGGPGGVAKALLESELSKAWP